jgi:ribosomal protein S18 acetylase RimI-like enzyme
MTWRTGPTVSDLEILLCPPDRRYEALLVFFRQAPPPLRNALAADSRRDAEQGHLDLSGLWIARRGRRIVGTLLSLHLAGRAAAIWPPEVALSWHRSVTAAALIRAALAGLQARGVRLVQALLDPDGPRQPALDLARAGLNPVTRLESLRRPNSLPLAQPLNAPGLHWVAFSPDTEPDFRRTLEASYQGSLDMPELDGVRSLDDILEGHRASGRFNPARWRLGRVPGEPDAAALLLLSEHPDRPAWEVSYLGLTPSARGRGLGIAALAHAVELARLHAESLELAVDTRNIPARELYARTGFTPYDRRVVHLIRL